MAYQKKGDNDKALEYLVKSLKIKNNVLEQGHPILCNTFFNIGMVYSVKG